MRWPWNRVERDDDDDLTEWALHHDDPRSSEGASLVNAARARSMSASDLFDAWSKANALVGQRAPADYGEFMAYGYFEGRLDALRLENES